MNQNPQPATEFLVVCLCAEWCATCRDYHDGFLAMTHEFSGFDFRWLDIEDHADLVHDFEVDSFPTLFIQRDDSVLFYGPMLPHHVHLRRMLENFRQQSREESRDYARRTAERLAWQEFSGWRATLPAAD